MKTILALSLLSAGTLTGFAQGTVTLANSFATSVTNALTMQPVVAGTTLRVALYYAPDGTPDDSSMVQLGAFTGFFAPGLYSGGTRTTPAPTAPGGLALF